MYMFLELTRLLVNLGMGGIAIPYVLKITKHLISCLLNSRLTCKDQGLFALDFFNEVRDNYGIEEEGLLKLMKMLREWK